LGDTPAIMVAADAWGGPLLLDRTPWRVVRVGPARARRAHGSTGRESVTAGSPASPHAPG
jgi:hypothetical protein